MKNYFISSGIELLDSCLGGGFRRKGSYLIASEKKAGKSSFVRRLIFNLLVLGRKVLLIDTEETEEDIIFTVASVAKQKDLLNITDEDLEDMKPVLENLLLLDCNQAAEEFYLEGEFSIDRLESFISKQVSLGAEVVVFDNVTRIGAETSANARMKVMAQLVRIAKKYGVLIFVVGHTPSTEVDTLDRKLVDRAIETRQFNELLNTTQNFVQRPKDPYGGSVTSQFDAVLIIWRPFQYYSLPELQSVSWLIVEQIRTASPFTLRMSYFGRRRYFEILDNQQEDGQNKPGPLWKKV